MASLRCSNFGIKLWPYNYGGSDLDLCLNNINICSLYYYIIYCLGAPYEYGARVHLWVLVIPDLGNTIRLRFHLLQQPSGPGAM